MGREGRRKPAPGGRDRPARSDAGHRLVPHTADCIIEAWGPDRMSCFVEAMSALVDVFAEVHDEPSQEPVGLSVQDSSGPAVLVSLLEEEIYIIDALGAVPVRFHLAETEDRRVTGEVEVVEAASAELVGPVPKGISYHGLEVTRGEGGRWTCRVMVDV